MRIVISEVDETTATPIRCVDMLIPDSDISLPFADIAKRYFQPAFEMLRQDKVITNLMKEAGDAL